MEWSKKLEVVRSKRSMVTASRNTDLVRVDWEPSRLIGLTGGTRVLWRSFKAARRGVGIPATAALELAGARVSGPARTRERKREGCGSSVSFAARGFL
jgi:hypothetical protein